jgi:hypothetical protein
MYLCLNLFFLGLKHDYNDKQDSHLSAIKHEMNYGLDCGTVGNQISNDNNGLLVNSNDLTSVSGVEQQQQSTSSSSSVSSSHLYSNYSQSNYLNQQYNYNAFKL